MFWAADKLSRKWFNEIFYRSYEGASEDRLVVLAEELFEDVIKPNIYPRAKDLIEESRRAGCRQVLLSGALDFTMRPLARYLGVDDLIANQLEFVDNYATGKLKKPFVAGATKADIMRDVRQAARHRPRRVVGVLRQLLATTRCSRSSAIRPPATPTCGCARWRARYDWPVLDLDEEPNRSAARRPQGLAPAPGVRRLRTGKADY